MAWSIAEVARMSGVTSRTLRHYHEIGLLEPARIGGNGYRHYEEDQLLRLQQILVLREMGLGLAEIKEIVDRHTDPLAEDGMPRISRPENLFEGFDGARYSEQAREQWPGHRERTTGS
ncbi:MerR family transcriptional regulator [Nonomuraea wenchangensis]|uniref:MerR family transcriptional regulator n=1 Tax=Nonomuraea wenchangensis TaxID=568860 RepID=UPI003716906C